MVSCGGGNAGIGRHLHSREMLQWIWFESEGGRHSGACGCGWLQLGTLPLSLPEAQQSCQLNTEPQTMFLQPNACGTVDTETGGEPSTTNQSQGGIQALALSPTARAGLSRPALMFGIDCADIALLEGTILPDRLRTL
ncbi:unnamed protein product [Pleuronectes platessa]|uniref:Uncharacterized protein n=1 Tax=Pleuronectes platessa TaxID=8262 RepID=A0A9N7U7B1_PLEPL|nr:unnamed protein product [Pleuronectes platessa]